MMCISPNIYLQCFYESEVLYNKFCYFSAGPQAKAFAGYLVPTGSTYGDPCSRTTTAATHDFDTN